MAKGKGNEKKTMGAADGARKVAETAKGAKDTAKVVTNLASQNYAGAIIAFLKNPKGIIMSIISFIALIAIFIVAIIGVLIDSMWAVFATGYTQDAVDRHIALGAKIEDVCFVPAQESVSDAALNEIIAKMQEINLQNAKHQEHHNQIFEDKESLQEYFGMGYNQMRRFADNGHVYTMYDKIKNSDDGKLNGGILPILEDMSTGHNNQLVNLGDSSMWVKKMQIFSMVPVSGTTEFDVVQYEFVYNNEKFINNGITWPMLQMIYNNKYEFDMHEKYNSPSQDFVKKLEIEYAKIDAELQYFNSLHNGEGVSSLTMEDFSETTSNGLSVPKYHMNNLHEGAAQIVSSYNNLEEDYYYLNTETLNKIRDYVNRANEIIKEYNKVYKNIYQNDGYMVSVCVLAEYSQAEEANMSEQRKQTQENKFVEFLGSEACYSKLLTYAVDVTTPQDIMPQYSLPAMSNSSGKEVDVITKKFTITVEINFCSYSELGVIFGYLTKNADGNYEPIKEVFEWTNLDLFEPTDSEENIESTLRSISNENSEDIDNNEEESLINDSDRFMLPLAASKEQLDSNSIKYIITNPYNSPKHKAIDFGVRTGTRVYASLPGKVVFASFDPVSGNTIKIEHTSGGNRYMTVYKHLSQIGVSVGQEITRENNCIGLSGNTGSASTGPHLHFEVHIFNTRDHRFVAINPFSVMGERPDDYMFFAGNVASAGMDLVIYFESAKDSGMSTSEIMTDAGYVKSYIYWQYKQRVFNQMFCCDVQDDSSLPFFADLDYIYRIEKIVAPETVVYGDLSDDGCSSGISNITGDTKLQTIANKDKQNKTYYKVYCSPKTLLQLKFTATWANFKYERHDGAAVNDKGFWGAVFGMNGEHVDGYAAIDGNFLYGFNTSIIGESSDFSIEDSLSISGTLNSGYYELLGGSSNLGVGDFGSRSISDKNFSMITYCLNNSSYGMEISGVQISEPEKNDSGMTEHFMTAGDYKSTVYSLGYLWSDVIGNQTIREYMKEHQESGYRMQGSVEKPLIMGNVLNSERYVGVEFNPNDIDTYPYFYISVAAHSGASELNINAESAELSTIFKLTELKDEVQMDKESTYVWPVVNAYERNTFVELDNYDGAGSSATVHSINRDNKEVVLKAQDGSLILFTGVEALKDLRPNDTIAVGQDFGKVIEPDNVFASTAYYDEGGRLRVGEALRVSSIIKIRLDVSARAEVSMMEDNLGRYNNVVSMASGEVVEVSDNHIVVQSNLDNLYHVYKGLKVAKQPDGTLRFSVGNWVSNGTVLGTIHIDNGDPDILSVYIYQKVVKKTYTSTYEFVSYHNPMEFFRNIESLAATARKLTVYDENNNEIKSLLLNPGDTKKVKVKVSLGGSNKNSDVIYNIGGENPNSIEVTNIVPVLDENGITKEIQYEITAAESSPGNAYIQFVFNDDLSAITGTVTTTVMNEYQNIFIGYFNPSGYLQTFNNSAYVHDYNANPIPENVAIVNADGSKLTLGCVLTDTAVGVGDNNVYYTLSSKTARGHKTSDYVRVSDISVPGVCEITFTQPMKKNDYIEVEVHLNMHSTNESEESTSKVRISSFAPVTQILLEGLYEKNESGGFSRVTNIQSGAYVLQSHLVNGSERKLNLLFSNPSGHLSNMTSGDFNVKLNHTLEGQNALLNDGVQITGNNSGTVNFDVTFFGADRLTVSSSYSAINIDGTQTCSFGIDFTHIMNFSAVDIVPVKSSGIYNHMVNKTSGFVLDSVANQYIKNDNHIFKSGNGITQISPTNNTYSTLRNKFDYIIMMDDSSKYGEFDFVCYYKDSNGNHAPLSVAQSASLAGQENVAWSIKLVDNFNHPLVSSSNHLDNSTSPGNLFNVKTGGIKIYHEGIYEVSVTIKYAGQQTISDTISICAIDCNFGIYSTSGLSSDPNENLLNETTVNYFTGIYYYPQYFVGIDYGRVNIRNDVTIDRYHGETVLTHYLWAIKSNPASQLRKPGAELQNGVNFFVNVVGNPNGEIPTTRNQIPITNQSKWLYIDKYINSDKIGLPIQINHLHGTDITNFGKFYVNQNK